MSHKRHELVLETMIFISKRKFYSEIVYIALTCFVYTVQSSLRARLKRVIMKYSCVSHMSHCG